MFKKPLSNLKTSAPLRSSDRRKLRQKVVQAFGISIEEGDVLVPEGLLSVKFLTHLDEPGIAYLAPDGGDPLWFTIGKNSDELIPTVYTLWKQPGLLPWLSTPALVIPKLVGGADLMIPGVVQWPPSIHQGQLVAITQYERDQSKRGYPLAVGHMAVFGEDISKGGKGKAVYVKHTWRDILWDMGHGGEVPEPLAIPTFDESTREAAEAAVNQGDPESADQADAGASQPTVMADAPTDSTQQSESNPEAALKPEEVTDILRTSLLHAIVNTLSKLPPASFPMIATSFYSSYILPSRPAFASQSSSTPIDIKHSSHKSLTAFLKAMEKDGLITLKTPKGKAGGDIVVTAVNPSHPDVHAHTSYTSIADVDAKREKRVAREEQERNKVKELVVTEKYKPMGSGSTHFFEECGKDIRSLYTVAEIRTIVNQYIQDKQLVNPREQQYVNIDETLLDAMQGNSNAEFLKREELVRSIIGKMQDWYEITPDGKDPILKKGTLKPVSVTVKIRQGRKAATLITGFEPFLVNPEELADDLRKVCASATSVSPIPGKSTGQEVFVQGKQIKAVTDLLLGKGIPKKWIEVADLSDSKKK